jgi:hypothetical protein
MNPRNRPAPSQGMAGKLHGEFVFAVASGLLTTVAAASATAGHVFALRNADASKKLLLRYLAIDFNLTVAFGAAQAMGFDAIVARSYSASHTGGTAIDLGGTNTNTNKRRVDQSTSSVVANAARIGTTGALTAGTHTLDANAFAQCQKWMGAVGAQISEVLLDARDDGGANVRSPIELGNNEGVILRNTILMGATGVGTLIVRVELDEITL